MTTPQMPDGSQSGNQPPQEVPNQPPLVGQPPVIQPQSRGGSGKIVGIILSVVILVVVVVGLGAIGMWLSKDDPQNAVAGDCLAVLSAEDDELEIVSCDDESAAYKVVGQGDEMTETEFMTTGDPCSEFVTAESAYWSGTSGDKGQVLCLEPIG